MEVLMGFRLFKFSILLIIIYMPIHIAVFFAAPGPIIIGNFLDEMAAKSLIYNHQVMVSDIALEYIDITLRALEIEAETGSLKELNELVYGEERWRSELAGRVKRLESEINLK